jgi:murein DD-endopeptidase MepM/ murein hydrolase activator NlpD
VTNGRSFAALLALAALIVTGVAPAAERRAEASASALGVRVVSPAGDATAAAVSAPPDATDGGSFSYGNDAVSAGSLATHAQAAANATGKAAATAKAGPVSLFDGEVTASSIAVQATATASGKSAAGSLAGSSVSGLTVLGEPIAASPNVRVPLGDWGYLVVLEQAVVPSGGTNIGRRVFVSGLHVRLTADHGGLPAGTDITVGYAEASASALKPPPPPPDPDPGQPPDDSGSGSGSGSESGGGNGSGPEGERPPRDPEPQPPGANPTPPPIVRNPPDDVKPNLTRGGYVFPVYGSDAAFANDFQAARATTGWHHGNDIFAPLGTPVLAVADGELFLVGVNAIGGNRLWLRDDSGNEFYYAHLSAYTPLAHNGARVKAGDVIGFVGTTGDALGTPPHLHFEIHPRGLLWIGYDGVVNPYAYLLAWRRLDDLAFDAFRDRPGKAPEPGVILLQAEDISTVSGLDPGALARVLSAPLHLTEVPEARTSSPGFAQPSL